MEGGGVDMSIHVHEMPFCTVYPFWQRRERRVSVCRVTVMLND